MNTTGNIVWLTSYPKSGNTWFRAFLTNLLYPQDQPAQINNMRMRMTGSSRDLFDEYVGIEASLLSQEEVLLYRPKIYELLSEELVGQNLPMFIKAHEAYLFNHNEIPVFPQCATKAVLYFVRNPLDVVASYANHSNISYDKSVQFMNDENHALFNKPENVHNQLQQKMFSWSGHINSWINADLPVCLIRYEDMLLHPLEVFKKAVGFCGLNFSDEEIKEALKKSSFSELQAQEKKENFREKAGNCTFFFRKGKSGGWKEELNKEQIKRIIEKHGVMMKKLGYFQELEEARELISE